MRTIRQHRTHGNGSISAFRDACAAIPDPTLRGRAEAFLRVYGETGHHAHGMKRAKIRACDLQRCRVLSPAFAALQDDLVAAVREARIREVEDAVVRSAVGDAPIVKGMERPSTRAAAVLLPANAPRYRRDRAAPMPVVSIAINL